MEVDVLEPVLCEGQAGVECVAEPWCEGAGECGRILAELRPVSVYRLWRVGHPGCDHSFLCHQFGAADTVHGQRREDTIPLRR